MANHNLSDPKHFHAEIEREGLDEIEARLPQYDVKPRAVGELVIAQYRREIQEKQRSKELEEQVQRDERAIEIARKSLLELQTGNDTQKYILWTLLATIGVTILVALFKG